VINIFIKNYDFIKANNLISSETKNIYNFFFSYTIFLIKNLFIYIKYLMIHFSLGLMQIIYIEVCKRNIHAFSIAKFL
jgi:hypothetical protein